MYVKELFRKYFLSIFYTNIINILRTFIHLQKNIDNGNKNLRDKYKLGRW